MLEIALKYIGQGYSVIPINMASKRPTQEWKKWQESVPPTTQVLRWFNGTSSNMAVLCGKVSGNLIVIDFDNSEYFHDCSEHLQAFPTVRTKKGYHVYIKTYDYIPVRNTKIAMDGDLVLAEIRGEGGYVLSEGSYFRGGKYEFVIGSIDDMAPIDTEYFEYILSVISIDSPKPDLSLDTSNLRSGDSNVIIVSNVHEYVTNLVRSTIRRVEYANSGDRNNQLFIAAATIGNLAGGKHIKPRDGTMKLYQAALNNGLVAEDGQRSIMQTIGSGVKRGMSNPMIVKLDDITAELIS